MLVDLAFSINVVKGIARRVGRGTACVVVSYLLESDDDQLRPSYIIMALPLKRRVAAYQ
jgi:hypothetical protein